MTEGKVQTQRAAVGEHGRARLGSKRGVRVEGRLVVDSLQVDLDALCSHAFEPGTLDPEEDELEEELEELEDILRIGSKTA